MMKEGWKYKKLGEVVRIMNGYAFKSSLYEDEGIRVMRITNVQKGQIVDDDPKYYPIDMADEIKKYLLKEKDLLMSLTGNVGRVGLLCAEMLPAALNQRVACLRIQVPELLLEFLFHLLNSDRFEQEAIISAKGIAQKNMSTEWLKDYLIPLPPISQQQSIVAELDKINEIIDLKKAQLNDLDLLAQSIFYEMFGDPIENPKGWEVKKLIEVVDEGCTISYGIVQPGDGVEDGIPVVRPVDLVNDVVEIKNLKKTTQEISDSYKRSILDGTEILMCVRGTTGIVSYASSELKGCNVTRGIVPIKVGNSIERTFLFQQFRSSALQELIAERTYGATLKQINMKDLRNLPLILPPLSLQQSFASKIQAIESQKSAIKQSLAEVETLLASRMDYYFN